MSITRDDINMISQRGCKSIDPAMMINEKCPQKPVKNEV